MIAVLWIVVFTILGGDRGASALDSLPPPPPCAESGSTSLTQGPFGGGPSGPSAAFDDAGFALGGAAPITAITVMSGSWVDSIQVKYGSTWGPRRGGTGGGNNSTLELRPGESIVSAVVRSGLYVDGITVRTSSGRVQVLGPNGGPSGAVATPCSSAPLRLVSISGIAASYLEAITLTWATWPPPSSPRRPSPRPPAPRPPPPGRRFPPGPPPPQPPSPQAVVPPVVSIGPFGGGGGQQFSDVQPLTAAGNPVNNAPRLTGIRVRSGSWIDAIQVAFGGTWGPVRGGSGGGGPTELVLDAGEVVVGAAVVYGGYVDALQLWTSAGRVLALGPYNAAAAHWAAPCPAGAYELVGIRGTSDTYLQQIELVWRVRGAVGVAAVALAEEQARAAGWRCEYGLNSVVRNTSTKAGNVPQCLTLAGQTSCMQGSCPSGLLRCASGLVGANSSLQPPTPAGLWGKTSCPPPSPSGSEWQDPTQWCPRASGLLGLPPPTPRTPIRIIALNLEVCDTGPAMTSSDVAKSLYDDPFGLQKYWGTISRGRAFFNRSTSIVRQVQLPCARFNRSVCDFNTWVDYVDANAAALGVPELPDYPLHRLWLVPASTACQDIGFSAGNNVYVRGDFGSGPNDYLNVFKHELGHSLGLSHSGRGDNAYGDSSDPMGYCQRCSYNAPHMLQLGWVRSVATLTAQQLRAGQPSAPMRLPPLADTSVSAAVLVVVPDWLQTVDTTTGGSGGASAATVALDFVVTVSYRSPVGQDAGLPSEYADAVHVHTAPAVAGGGDIWLQSLLRAGQSATVASAKLVVRVDSITPSSVASVRVCRFVAAASECGA